MGKFSMMFLFSAFLLSSFLLSAARHASFPGEGIFPSKVKASTPECDAVYGAVKGDSCFSVAQMFNLTTAFFDSINPNLNCDKIFVGQWLCVDGSA